MSNIPDSAFRRVARELFNKQLEDNLRITGGVETICKLADLIALEDAFNFQNTYSYIPKQFQPVCLNYTIRQNHFK